MTDTTTIRANTIAQIESSMEGGTMSRHHMWLALIVMIHTPGVARSYDERLAAKGALKALEADDADGLAACVDVLLTLAVAA